MRTQRRFSLQSLPIQKQQGLQYGQTRNILAVSLTCSKRAERRFYATCADGAVFVRLSEIEGS